MNAAATRETNAMKRTVQQWYDLARCTTRNHTEEDLIAIAFTCVDAEERGEYTSVWHSASLVTKTKCICMQCRPTTA
jgi:hypothetical protein